MAVTHIGMHGSKGQRPDSRQSCVFSVPLGTLYSSIHPTVRAVATHTIIIWVDYQKMRGNQRQKEGERNIEYAGSGSAVSWWLVGAVPRLDLWHAAVERLTDVRELCCCCCYSCCCCLWYTQALVTAQELWGHCAPAHNGKATCSFPCVCTVLSVQCFVSSLLKQVLFCF